MGQFACECNATGSGRDQCDWTDIYVAQFKLLDGSVVYVGGEYDTWNGRRHAAHPRIEAARRRRHES